MNDGVLLAKLALGLAAVAGWILLDRYRRPDPALVSVRREAAWLWAVTRLGAFAGAFLVLGLDVSSDIPRFYLPQVRAVIDGGLVYRDYVSSYAPLFPWLAAGPVALWNDARSLVLFAIAWEALAVLTWAAVGARSMTPDVLRTALRLYLLNPLPILNVALLGQNQIWVCALWGMAAWAMVTGRSSLSGAAAAFSAVGVKLLGVLMIPILWWRAGSRGGFLTATVATLVAGIGPFVVAGADVLQPLRLEGDQLTSGNLPFLLTWAGLQPGEPVVALMLSGGLVLALGITAVRLNGLMTTQPAGQGVAVGIAGVVLVLLLVSRKAYAGYLVMALLPLCLAIAPRLQRRAVGIPVLAVGALASIEPSLWFRWMGESTLAGVGWPADPRVAAFLLVECLLITLYIWLLVTIWPARRPVGLSQEGAVRDERSRH